MKREDQKRNRELKENLNLILKESPKGYKKQQLKKIDYMLWTIRNGMIFNFFPFAYIREEDLKPVCNIKIGYKPLVIDELLWDVLGMESNKNEPDSLKVVGAFTAVSAKYENYIIEFPAENVEDVRTIIFKEIDRFLENIVNLTKGDYIDYVIRSEIVRDMDKVLVYIYQGEIIQAKKIVKISQEDGRFVIGNKTYKDLLINYLAGI